jgi:hypothetical protein
MKFDIEFVLVYLILCVLHDVVETLQHVGLTMFWPKGTRYQLIANSW